MYVLRISYINMTTASYVYTSAYITLATNVRPRICVAKLNLKCNKVKHPDTSQ